MRIFFKFSQNFLSKTRLKISHTNIMKLFTEKSEVGAVPAESNISHIDVNVYCFSFTLIHRGTESG